MFNGRKHIHQLRIEPHTPEWLAFREERGYGASEISSCLSEYSDILRDLVYTPAIKLHMEKIGEPVTRFSGNPASRQGHFVEPILINFYKHWNDDQPDQMTMYDNIDKDIKYHRVIAKKVFMLNDKYEHLFASPDGIEYNDSGKPIAIIECKNTTSMEANRYEDGLSPSFVLQVQQNLLISELPVAKILKFVDGCWFDVITIPADPKIQETIVKKSAQSWIRVLKARKIKMEASIDKYYGMSDQLFDYKQILAIRELQKLEPETSGTSLEIDFIKEMYTPPEEEVIMEGTPEQWEAIVKRDDLKKQIKELERQVNQQDIKLIESIAGFNKAVFGDNEKAYYSFKNDKNGKPRLYVSRKIFD